MNKPIEYYIALGSAALWVLMSHKEKTWVMRFAIAFISFGMGFSLSEDIAQWSGRGETLVGMVVAAFGWMILDFFTSVLSDRDAMKKAFWNRVGGGK